MTSENKNRGHLVQTDPDWWRHWWRQQTVFQSVYISYFRY